MQVIYRNSLAAPLFSLVATATRASRRPMPEVRAESGYMLDRGSRSVPWKSSTWEDCRLQICGGVSEGREPSERGLPVEGVRWGAGSRWARCIHCYAQSRGDIRGMQWMGCGPLRYCWNLRGRCVPVDCWWKDWDDGNGTPPGFARPWGQSWVGARRMAGRRRFAVRQWFAGSTGRQMQWMGVDHGCRGR